MVRALKGTASSAALQCPELLFPTRVYEAVNTRCQHIPHPFQSNKQIKSIEIASMGRTLRINSRGSAGGSYLDPPASGPF